MKSAMRKTVRREIGGSFMRFAAIFAITALGVSVFSGLLICRDVLVKTADGYLSRANLFDYQLISTLGYDDESVEQLNAAEEVRLARGSYSLEVIATHDGADAVYTACTITEGINELTVTAGRMPETSVECIADGAVFGPEHLGSWITISPENTEETQDSFLHRKYLIVGIAESPIYINNERGTTSLGSGTRRGYFYLREEAFTLEAYTEVYLLLENAPGEIYSDTYSLAIRAQEVAVTDLANAAARDRYDRIVAEAQAEIDDAQAELDDGWSEYRRAENTANRELEDARGELQSAQNQVDSYNAQLTAGEQALASGQSDLDGQRAALLEGQAQLDAARVALEQQTSDVRTQLNAAASGASSIAAVWSADPGYAAAANDPATYIVGAGLSNAGPAELLAAASAASGEASAVLAAGGTPDYSKLKTLISATQSAVAAAQSALDAQYAAADAQLDASQAEIDAGLILLDSAQQMLDQNASDLAAARASIESANRELSSGWEEFYRAESEAQSELRSARSELYDAQAEIDDAQAELDELEFPDIFVLDRMTNVGYACFESDSAIIQAIARIFPLFFFLVAALVCSTTMSRMIEEQRTQIGILKALGYSRRAIRRKYSIYSGTAAITGWAVGYFAGCWIFPTFVWNAYSIMYRFTDRAAYLLDPVLGAVALTISLICSVGVTRSACSAELAEVPAQLMRPKAPKAGKRVLLERLGFLWRRLGFFNKVMIRNISRYKKRLIMMVLGIGGCTALLLTGFGIQDSIQDVVDYQFSEVQLYDIEVIFTDPMDEAAQEEFLAETEGMFSDTVFLYQAGVDVVGEDLTKSAALLEGSEELAECFRFTDGETSLPLPEEGEVLLCISLAEKLGLEVGDSVELVNEDYRRLTVEVSGIFSNYVSFYIVLSPESCAALCGETPEVRTAFLTAEGDVYEASAALLDLESVAGVTINEDMRLRVNRAMESLDLVIVLIIAIAGTLAFIVLYNLTNINITEREREIATIKVLGFTRGETARYVLSENFVLTLLGAGAGMLLGRLFHWFVMTQVKVDMMYFDVRVDAGSYLYALLLTVVFTVITDLFMLRKLRRVNMAESMKSIE